MLRKFITQTSLVFIPFVTAFPLAHLVHAQEVVAEAAPQSGSIILETIEGNGFVVVRKAGGKNEQAQAGMKIEFGDTIKTGPQSSAKLRYPDGSKLLVGRASEIEVQAKQNDIQYNKVYSGYVRGLIRKSSAPRKDAPPRFIIRSRTVVMGVRGTDFVLDDVASQANAKIHTFEGTVEVAKNEKTLMKGKGVKVSQNQMVTADAKVISDPVEFSLPEVEGLMKAAQPDFGPMIQADLGALEAARADAPAPEAVAVPVVAAEAGLLGKSESENERRSEGFKNSWLNFQLGATYFTQFDTNSQFLTGQAAWTPRFKLILPFRASLSIAPVHNGGDGDDLWVSELGLQLSFKFLWKFFIEPGVAVQHWNGRDTSNDTNLVPLVQIAFILSEGAWIERLYFGVTHNEGVVINRKDVDPEQESYLSTLQVRAGIGFHF